jgi:lysyl-tRNA synthetase class 2
MAKPVFTAKSTTIHKIEYNEGEKAMDIEFRSGNVYRYHNVLHVCGRFFSFTLNAKAHRGLSLMNT